MTSNDHSKLACCRRVALRTLGAGIVSVGAACSSGAGVERVVNLGPASGFSAGDLVLERSAQIIVGRDQAGFYAMSATCTHAGCDITRYGRISGNVIECGCHGAQFDTDGSPVRGPARRALPHYRVEIDDVGDLIVYVGQTEAADVRVTV